MTLREYQLKGVEDIRTAYRSGFDRVLYTAPTGSGKTVLFTFMASEASRRKKRTLILMHRVELIRQTSDKLKEFGVPHGVIHPDYRYDLHHYVQVASIQTLSRRLSKIPYRFDLIIRDEAHHATTKTDTAIYSEFSDARILGVTATPIRTDGAGLIEVFETLVNGPTVRELINAGYLSDYRIFAPSTVDRDSFRSKMGDFDLHDLDEAMDKPKIIGDAVETYAKYSRGLPGVYFCVTVKHARHQADAFRAAGIRAESIDGGLPDTERKRMIEGLGSGNLDVLVSCEIVSEGTDIPAINTAGLLRPTQSLSLYLQQVGRALRLFPGKKHAIILDHVGNCKQHGFPDDEREWSLEGKKRSGRQKEEPAENVKQCEQCYFVYRPAPACPNCGFAGIPKPKREIETEAGELKELDPYEKRRIRGYEMSKIRTLEDAIAYGASKGYKPGWAHFYWQSNQRKQAMQEKQAI